MTTLDDIYLIEVAMPGIPGTGVSDIEKAQIQSDLATLDTRLDTQRLKDHTDVVIGTPTEGMAIVWNATTSKWNARTLDEAVRYVKESGAVVGEHIDRINFSAGLDVGISGTEDEQADVSVSFAGSGTAPTAARSDHAHNGVVFLEDAFPSPVDPVLSGGTKLLYEEYTGNLADGVRYDIEAIAFISVRSSTATGSGRFHFRIQLGQGETLGSVREREYLVVSNSPRLCRVRWVFANWLSTGGGVRVRVSAAYVNGTAVTLLDGDVSASAHPRR